MFVKSTYVYLMPSPSSESRTIVEESSDNILIDSSDECVFSLTSSRSAARQRRRVNAQFIVDCRKYLCIIYF